MRRVFHYNRCGGIVRVYSVEGDSFVEYRSSAVPTYKKALEDVENKRGLPIFYVKYGCYDAEQFSARSSAFGAVEVLDEALACKTSEDYM